MAFSLSFSFSLANIFYRGLSWGKQRGIQRSSAQLQSKISYSWKICLVVSVNTVHIHNQVQLLLFSFQVATILTLPQIFLNSLSINKHKHWSSEKVLLKIVKYDFVYSEDDNNRYISFLFLLSYRACEFIDVKRFLVSLKQRNYNLRRYLSNLFVLRLSLFLGSVEGFCSCSPFPLNAVILLNAKIKIHTSKRCIEKAQLQYKTVASLSFAGEFAQSVMIFFVFPAFLK